ncbi:MAG: presenilin family intramembrane aspartyl protease [Candidatus Pacearchaeota archaeon]
MKHNIKITIVLIAMFIITQFIGLYVVGHYLGAENALPFNLDQPTPETDSDYYGFFSTIIIAFVIAIALFFLLTKFKISFVLRAWFFIVVAIALSISLISIFSPFVQYAFLISLIISFSLAFIKIYGRNFFIHNFTELLIYPGIAAIFVPILNVYTVLALLLIISVYDAWAVWHSGVMQKMAKYQIDNLKIFAGFFVPYASKNMKSKIKKWKKTLSKSELKKKKIKVSVAILGGGDVVFPIITAGVVMNTVSIAMPFGLKEFIGGFWPAVFVIAGATLGLVYLFFFSEKRKFYPAMPFITAGILLGMLASYLVF